jgi:hypothetical protein
MGRVPIYLLETRAWHDRDVPVLALQSERPGFSDCFFSCKTRVKNCIIVRQWHKCCFSF